MHTAHLSVCDVPPFTCLVIKTCFVLKNVIKSVIILNIKFLEVYFT